MKNHGGSERPYSMPQLDEWDDGTGRYIELLALIEDTMHGPAWHKDAACKEHPEINFFPQRGDTGELRRAKAVCAGCNVKTECLEASHGEREGVWGGMSAAARRKHRRQQLSTPHGTETGYKSHLGRGEKPCERCEAAHERLMAMRASGNQYTKNAEYKRAQRARERARRAGELGAAKRWGTEPEEVDMCGTRAGYERHRRAGTETCDACRVAKNEYDRRVKAARREERSA